MPGVVRRASWKLLEPVSAITSSVITVTDFGVSINGAVNFWLADVLTLYSAASFCSSTLTSGKTSTGSSA